MELTQCLFLGDESLRYFAAQMLREREMGYVHIRIFAIIIKG